jgi:hypothetical protein
MTADADIFIPARRNKKKQKIKKCKTSLGRVFRKVEEKIEKTP